MNASALINMLLAFLRDEPINEPISDWSELIELATRQSVLGMLFLPLVKSENLPEKEICAKLESAYFNTLREMSNVDFVKNKIISAFDEQKVSAVFFKGIIAKDAYPVPELRTMGDIDFFVKTDERERSDKALLSLGAKRLTGAEPIYTYRLDGVLLEVHTQFAEKLYNKDKASKVYERIWENTKSISKYCFAPTEQFHILLMIIHTFRHFTGVGCGVRLFMDIGVFYDKFKDEIDLQKLKADLKECELFDFAKLVFYLNHRWFGYDNSFDADYDEKIYQDVTDYIMSCGTFGSDFGTMGAKSTRERLSGKKGIARFFAKVKFFLGRVFPSCKYMKNHYSFVKKAPILLPVGWIVNIAHQLKYRGKYLAKYSKDVFVSSEDDKKVYDLFDRLGL